MVKFLDFGTNQPGSKKLKMLQKGKLLNRIDDKLESGLNLNRETGTFSPKKYDPCVFLTIQNYLI